MTVKGQHVDSVARPVLLIRLNLKLNLTGSNTVQEGDVLYEGVSLLIGVWVSTVY